jgi:hypothetical protein
MATQTKATTKSTPTPATETKTAEPKKNGKTLWIVLGVGAFLLCICVLCVVGVVLISKSATKTGTGIFDELQDEINNEIEKSLDDTLDSGFDVKEPSDGGIYASIPDSFPSDLPIFPGASITYTYEDETYGDYSSVSFFTNEATVEELTDYYMDELDTNGWTIDEDFSGGGIIYTDKGANSVTIYMYEGTENGVNFTISVSKD